MCIFEQEFWFFLSRYTRNKNQSVHAIYVRYIQSDITNPWAIWMLDDVEFMQEMFYLTIFLSPTSNEGEEFDDTDWN